MLRSLSDFVLFSETGCATSTFDRKIEIQDVESLKKLIDVMNADVPQKPLSQHPFSDAERGVRDY